MTATVASLSPANPFGQDTMPRDERSRRPLSRKTVSECAKQRSITAGQSRNARFRIDHPTQLDDAGDAVKRAEGAAHDAEDLRID